MESLFLDQCSWEEEAAFETLSEIVLQYVDLVGLNWTGLQRLLEC